MDGNLLMLGQARQIFEDFVITKAFKEPAFKNELLHAPTSALKAMALQSPMDVSLPDNVQLKVLEEDENTVYLVLPIDYGDGELFIAAHEDAEDAEAMLVARAQTDRAFRAELLASPKAVIEKEFIVELPDDLEVVVLEETSQTRYLVLPVQIPQVAPAAVTEEMLASIGYSLLEDWTSDDECPDCCGGENVRTAPTGSNPAECYCTPE